MRTPQRRFPPPWQVRELEESFVIEDDTLSEVMRHVAKGEALATQALHERQLKIILRELLK